MAENIQDLVCFLARSGREGTPLLKRLEERYAPHRQYRRWLVKLASDENREISIAATWLIKSYLQKGGALSSANTRQLIAFLEKIVAWEAVLHICQCIQFIKVEHSQAETLFHWLLRQSLHERGFVRAWSTDGLCRLAVDYNDYRILAQRTLAKAEVDSAASVRARARNIRKASGL